MKYIESRILNYSNRVNVHIPNLLGTKVIYWIPDEGKKTSIVFKYDTDFEFYPPNFGHFSHKLSNEYILAGSKILINNKYYVIQKIIDDGTSRGSIILNGNPKRGIIQKLDAVELTDNGLQFVLSQDDDYDISKHGDKCWYTAYGVDGHFLGDYFINVKDFIVNKYTCLVGNYSPEAFKIKVESVEDFRVGMEILLHQTQHSDLNRVGSYAFNFIEDIDTVKKIIKLKYTIGDYFSTVRYNSLESIVCQVISVPHYKTLTIKSGCSITCDPWNGRYGGIIALRAKNAIINNGEIYTTGLGFRGGVDYIKKWWDCSLDGQTTIKRSRMEPTGGEGTHGIDANYGILYPDPEPECHFPPPYPTLPLPPKRCTRYNNIQNMNMNLQYGGGGYIVTTQPYFEQSRVCTGFGPGSGGGSYTAGGDSIGVHSFCCGWTRGQCGYFYAGTRSSGGFKIEYDRSLALNLGCGGASAGTIYPTKGTFRGKGGNGGGLIMLYTHYLENNGEIITNGVTGQLNYHLKDKVNFDASTGGGGGAGQLLIDSEKIVNNGIIETIGGPGYILDPVKVVRCYDVQRHVYIYEMHDMKSGEGGNGHIVHTASEFEDNGTISTANIEYLTKMLDYRIGGYFGYDYRLLWHRLIPIYALKDNLLDCKPISKMDNYYLICDNRNTFYDATQVFRYGLVVNNKLKLYDYIYKNYSTCREFDIIRAMVHGHIHTSLNSQDYLVTGGIDKYTNFVGFYFAMASDHHIYSPLIHQVDYHVAKKSYNIWYEPKIRDYYTVKSNLFDKLMDN